MKIKSIVLSAVLILLLACIPVSASAKQGFANALINELDKMDLSYEALNCSIWSRVSLIYIDNDDIPEVFLEGGSVADGCHLLVYNPKTDIVECSVFRYGSYEFIERGNCFYESSGRQGTYFDIIYTLENRNPVALHSGKFTRPYPVEPDIKEAYTWDNSIVSKAEYDSNVNAYFNHAEALNSQNNTTDIYDIKNMLRQMDIKVNVNGENVDFDYPPILENGRTLVPLRKIFEKLAAEVEWDSQTYTVTAKKDDNLIKLTIGSNTMYKNGISIPLDVAPRLSGNYTLVPARAIAEAFSAKVNWSNDERTVTITK